MLESVVVLYVCSVLQQCQVISVMPDEETCKIEMSNVVAERGQPPEGLSLICKKYLKEEDK